LKQPTVSKGKREEPGGISLPIAPRESLSARSAIILKRYLLTEHINPGDRLPPERRLAEALNVSRTVLREAINQLVGEGLVRREPSRSPVVIDFDRAQLAHDLSVLDDREAEVADLIELRVMIELGAIRAVVERASEADFEEFEHWVAEGERRVEIGVPLTIPEVRFHAALLRTLGNQSINALLPLIEENMRRNLLIDPHELGGQSTASDRRAIRDHRRIFEAVRSRDADAAAALMIAHLEPYVHPERYTDENGDTRAA
jgi:GntR family transcriptional repressor for pyruvate dehydrogenase complex